MEYIETDYLVVGAGASGMAFVDTLLQNSDADVIMVDQRHQPGGHWNDAYPFVQLHQPAACYGVDSSELGQMRIDRFGDNEGMYELSSATEICSYFREVMDQVFLPTGRVRFYAMHRYTEDGPGTYRLRSLLTGSEFTVRVRRKLVDAAYMQPSIPARQRPEYVVDEGVTLLTPNQLVEVAGPPAGFTVIGAGKTAMDVCTWLLRNGVDPDSISWVRSRDGWFINREWSQPLDMVETRLRYQSTWARAAAQASNGLDMARRLEQDGLMLRLDESAPTTGFRGATISPAELKRLARIERVVRGGRVKRIGSSGIDLGSGSISRKPGEIYVDCTATGLRTLDPRPIFEPNRITMQYITPGYACWSAALLGVIEAEDAMTLAEKNELALPVVYTGHVDDLLNFTQAMLWGSYLRSRVPAIAEWSDATRLNPARGFREQAEREAVGSEIRRWVSWSEKVRERMPLGAIV